MTNFSWYVGFPCVFAFFLNIHHWFSVSNIAPVLMIVHYNRNAIISSFSINLSFCLDYIIIKLFFIFSEFSPLLTYIYISSQLAFFYIILLFFFFSSLQNPYPFSFTIIVLVLNVIREDRNWLVYFIFKKWLKLVYLWVY